MATTMPTRCNSRRNGASFRRAECVRYSLLAEGLASGATFSQGYQNTCAPPTCHRLFAPVRPGATCRKVWELELDLPALPAIARPYSAGEVPQSFTVHRLIAAEVPRSRPHPSRVRSFGWRSGPFVPVHAAQGANVRPAHVSRDAYDHPCAATSDGPWCIPPWDQWQRDGRGHCIQNNARHQGSSSVRPADGPQGRSGGRPGAAPAAHAFRRAHWRRFHHRPGWHGWAGPVFLRYAYDDTFDTFFWSYGLYVYYDDLFWDYGYGGIYGELFSPYSFDDFYEPVYRPRIAFAAGPCRAGSLASSPRT